MATRNDFRVSDAERDSVAAELREHFVQGRLTFDELQDRLDVALTARTRRQLDRVVGDLPRPPAPAARPPLPVGPPLAARLAALVVIAALLAAWLLATAWSAQHGFAYGHLHAHWSGPYGYVGPR